MSQVPSTQPTCQPTKCNICEWSLSPPIHPYSEYAVLSPNTSGTTFECKQSQGLVKSNAHCSRLESPRPDQSTSKVSAFCAIHIAEMILQGEERVSHFVISSLTQIFAGIIIIVDSLGCYYVAVQKAGAEKLVPEFSNLLLSSLTGMPSLFCGARAEFSSPIIFSA